jgi:hypothetical protein
MSEVNFRNKGPAPQVHDNSKLQVRQGSPAHYQATSSAMKTEIRPMSTVHTMGAKNAAPPPHLAGRQPAQPPKVLGGTAPARAPGAPNVLGRAPTVLGQRPTPQAPQHKPGAVSKPKPGAVNRSPVTPAQPQSTQPATPAQPQLTSPTVGSAAQPVNVAPLEVRLISPAGAVLLGQILEMFLASEQFSGRGESDLVKLGIKTLTDMHPLFPPGVEIPVPNVTPPPGQQGPSVVMVDLPQSQQASSAPSPQSGSTQPPPAASGSQSASQPSAASGSQSTPVITPPSASAPNAPSSGSKPA